MSENGVPRKLVIFDRDIELVITTIKQWIEG